MSQAETSSRSRAQADAIASDLKVSAHVMNLDPGLFCIVQSPLPARDAARGLPGVRISLSPAQGRSDGVTIRSFRDDGWLHSHGDAALVRVERGPAQILVTIYQAADAEAAPNLQVLRLLDPAAAGQPHAGVPGQPPQPGAQAVPSREAVDVIAHVQGRGDVGGMIGQWVGERGSKRWIEGFALAPVSGVKAADVEYQAVLGRGWMSPWVEGGQFCGSRGMALPLLGLRVRLRGAAAETFRCSYFATFVDGAELGQIRDGEPCETESLAAIEAFRIVIEPREAAAATAASAARAAKPAPKPVAPPPRAAARKPAPPPAPPVRGRRR